MKLSQSRIDELTTKISAVHKQNIEAFTELQGLIRASNLTDSLAEDLLKRGKQTEDAANEAVRGFTQGVTAIGEFKAYVEKLHAAENFSKGVQVLEVNPGKHLGNGGAL